MKVLVTGGAGFIGSHIVAALMAANYHVVVVDDLSSGHSEYVSRQIPFYQVDILDQPELRRVFDRERPDYVIHQAAQVSVPYSMAHPGEDAQVNIVGTVNLAVLCVEYQVKKLIFASSAAVYGQPQYLPIDEAHPIQPLSYYGLSKYTAEQYLIQIASQHELNYTILRYANVYGPRQDAHGEAGVVSIFIDRLLKGDRPVIFGDGRQTRDFIFVQDVAQANVRAIHHGDRQIVNVGCQQQTSLLELIQQLSSITGREIQPEFRPARPGDIPHSCLAIDRAKKGLGWAPRHTLREGLSLTLADYVPSA